MLRVQCMVVLIALSYPLRASTIIDTPSVVAALKRGVLIWDVRTRGEFSGNDIRATRGGHVPGALNIPYEEIWIDPETPSKLGFRNVKVYDSSWLVRGDQVSLPGFLPPRVVRPNFMHGRTAGHRFLDD